MFDEQRPRVTPQSQSPNIPLHNSSDQDESNSSPKPLAPQAVGPKTSFDKPKPKKGKKRIIIGVISFVVILIAAGSVLVYLTLKKVDYQQLLVESVENIKKLNSYSNNTEMEFIMIFDPEYLRRQQGLSTFMNQEYKMKVLLQQQVINKPEPVQTAGTFTLTFPDGLEIPFLGQLDISPSVKYISKAEENIFFRLENLPSIMFFNLDSIEDQWIKVDLEKFKEKYGADFMPMSSEDILGGVNKEELKQIQQKFENLMQQYPIVDIVDVKKEKKFNESVYHLKLRLNKENFKKFISEIFFTLYEEFPGYGDVTTDISGLIEEFEAGLDEFLSETNINIEVWISKKNRLLRQLVANVSSDIKENKYGSYNNIEKENVGKMYINMVSTLADINKPIVVEEPVDYIELDDFIQQLETLGSSLNFGMPSSGSEVDINALQNDSDSDGLTDYQENFYGTDPNNPDSDGDGFTDGDEIDNGYNPLGEGRL